MLVIRSRRVVFPEGEQPAVLRIAGGRFVAVAPYGDAVDRDGLVDVGTLVVSPGIVDTHVHVNEPGRADWEGFDTATRAAAAGGVTTIVDMPLNSIPATVDVPSLEAKRHAACGQCHVDVGFWGGIVPGNADRIPALLAAGVRGFKCFLAPSGVDEFPAVGEADLRLALPVLAREVGRSRPLLVHAEMPSLIRAPSGNPRAFATFLATRPAVAEADAIRMMAALAAEYHVAAHVVHVSSAEGVREVAAARAAGISMTAETCPHYLTMAADEIPDGATAFKCAPPVRTDEHQAALWDALRQGVCAMVVSDHSPAPPALKALETGDFLRAWGGIASLQLSLAAVWTGASSRGFTVEDVARWMSLEPSRLCGLDRKGSIRVGADADLVVWDPDAQFSVSGARLQHRHPLTPYEGRALRGLVRSTYVRGVRVWDEGRLVTPGQGGVV